MAVAGNTSGVLELDLATSTLSNYQEPGMIQRTIFPAISLEDASGYVEHDMLRFNKCHGTRIS